MFHLSLKPAEVTESDLEKLISGDVVEGKEIEYKSQLPGGGDADKKEFLADISSFLNTVGGHIVYGMTEVNGSAKELSGISGGEDEGHILRLEEIIRTGLEPRAQGIAIGRMALKNENSVIVIYIPRSWQAPHRIAFKNDSKFYGRNSRGKYQFDVAEIRSAFVRSETAGERIRNFRAERLNRIKIGETPIELLNDAKIVIHACHMNMAESLSSFDIPALINQPADAGLLEPFHAFGWTHRPNLDGLATYTSSGSGASSNYLQIFRNGAIEAVSVNLTDVDDRSGYLPSIAYEREIIAQTKRMLQLMNAFSIDLPVFIMISLLGVKGYRMGVDEFSRSVPENPFIDRDDLILPELEVQSYDEDISQVLRPSFDAIWNAAGWQRCWNYNEEGIWGERR